jgi:segregation and condensation protein A
MLTVRVRMAQLLRLLKRSGRLSFSDLALRASGRRDIIVTFLALLELMRRRRVRVEQPEPFADLSLTMPGRAASRQRVAR